MDSEQARSAIVTMENYYGGSTYMEVAKSVWAMAVAVCTCASLMACMESMVRTHGACWLWDALTRGPWTTIEADQTLAP